MIQDLDDSMTFSSHFMNLEETFKKYNKDALTN